MTKKRFDINNLAKKGDISFWDNETKTILNASRLLDLLNDLADKNEQLNKYIDELLEEYIGKLYNKNDKCKKELEE